MPETVYCATTAPAASDDRHGRRRYQVRHRTHYAYDDDVSASYERAMLRPRETPSQRIVSHEIGVDPAPGVLDERTDERLDAGDHERLSHYVAKHKLTEAMVMGTPVVALCGKVWVPSRDPSRFPVCPTCEAIYKGLAPGPRDNDSE